MYKSIYDPIEVDAEYFLEHEREEDDFYQKARSLPEPLADILFGEDTPEIIKRTLTRYNLTPKQCEETTRLIKKILLLELPLKELGPKVRSMLGLDPEASRQLGQELTEELFSTALEHLTSTLTTDTPASANPNNVINLRDQNR